MKQQHTARTLAEAKSVFGKIENSLVAQAVFVTPKTGLIRMTKVTTALCREALQRTPERLMGVYDHDCRMEWLADDLAYMGVR